MREISREEHEVTLNLFIISFIGIPCFDVYSYNLILKHNTRFSVCKECFPMDEVCEEIRETTVTLSCACCSGYIYLPANYIKEV